MKLVALAIALVAPSLPKAQRDAYAKELMAVERQYGLPALLGVAIIENESHFHRSLTHGVGTEEMIGLGQIRLGNYRPCRSDPEAPACAAVRAMLLDGAANIREMGKTFRANRRYCTRHGKKGIAAALAGYQAYRCRPARLTKKVLGRWHDLERRLSRGGRRR